MIMSSSSVTTTILSPGAFEYPGFFTISTIAIMKLFLRDSMQFFHVRGP